MIAILLAGPESEAIVPLPEPGESARANPETRHGEALEKGPHRVRFCRDQRFR